MISMKIIAYIIGLALLQVLLFNHIVIFDVAMPLVFVYLAVMMPRNYPRWASLITCFAMGLAMDMFNNTPGVAAAAMTLTGFCQPYILGLFLDNEDAPNLDPSVSTMGIQKYSVYAALTSLLFFLSFFIIEAFSFTHWLDCLMQGVSSLVVTLILILTFDIIRSRY